MRTISALLIATMVVLSGVVPVAVAATPAEGPTYRADVGSAVPSDAPTAQEDNATAPDDPEEDVIGWENGYWHNESLDIDRSDGVNDSELDAVVARSMARVEVVRELEFNESVPIEVISREEYREINAERFGNATANERLHQNVKWEAAMFVNESTDAMSVQQANFGASVLGFYSPEEERMVIVSENQTSPRLSDEFTLAHELVHAVQDQQYNLSSIRANTTDGSNANNGLIEGDANYVQHRYEQRCGEEWNCLEPRQGAPGGELANFGLYLVSFQPYSDGPSFIQHQYESGGWAAVNEMYDAPPQSSEQVIHPDRYRSDEPTTLSVEDRSNEEWRVLELEDGINYASFGEAGMMSMFVYPAYDDRPNDYLISQREFVNLDGQQVDSFDPLNYTHPYTEGWDGDRLVPYVTDDSAETNETGYVWVSAWDSEADAAEFVEGYRELLDYRNAQAVEGYDGVYRIPDSEEYGDAFYVEQRGDRVIIVNAPTLDDLSGVHGDAPDVSESDLKSDDSDSSGGETTANGSDGDGSNEMDSDATTEDDSVTDGMPGFGVGAAVAAVLGSALLARRRA
jgi:PGF-CTERM protein